MKTVYANRLAHAAVGPRRNRWGVLIYAAPGIGWHLFVKRSWPNATIDLGNFMVTVGRLQRPAHNHPAIPTSECPQCHNAL